MEFTDESLEELLSGTDMNMAHHPVDTLGMTPQQQQLFLAQREYQLMAASARVHAALQQQQQQQRAPACRTRSFSWEPCTYLLQNMTGTSWPVSPNVMAQVSVQMDRTPTASPDGLQAWLWHKNCVLPSIHVHVNSKESLVGAAVLLTAATIDVLEHIAVERGLEGDAMRLLVNGSCSFSSLAFKTTSYNLKGKPLHLLAVLLVRPAAGEPLHPYLPSHPCLPSCYNPRHPRHQYHHFHETRYT